MFIYDAKPRERLRSFVCRNSRKTKSQQYALAHWFNEFCFDEKTSVTQLHNFMQQAPTYIEIGFGHGHSLLAAAKAHPDKQFIGIETHQPGIGSLLVGIKQANLSNIRIIYGDAVTILKTLLPNACAKGILIFFPDPWPKRKHLPRRLIQTAFVSQLITKLKKDGTLHFATDWEDYAKHMMQVLSAFSNLQNLAGDRQFSTRSLFRPITSKFENRAIKEGRPSWDLQFVYRE